MVPRRSATPTNSAGATVAARSTSAGERPAFCIIAISSWTAKPANTYGLPRSVPTMIGTPAACRSATACFMKGRVRAVSFPWVTYRSPSQNGRRLGGMYALRAGSRRLSSAARAIPSITTSVGHCQRSASRVAANSSSMAAAGTSS